MTKKELINLLEKRTGIRPPRRLTVVQLEKMLANLNAKPKLNYEKASAEMEAMNNNSERGRYLIKLWHNNSVNLSTYYRLQEHRKSLLIHKIPFETARDMLWNIYNVNKRRALLNNLINTNQITLNTRHKLLAMNDRSIRYDNMSVDNLYKVPEEELRKALQFVSPTFNFSKWTKDYMIRWLITKNVTKASVSHKGAGYIPPEIAVLDRTICRSGRLQIKGTCWFQAILNGWLLSTYGRHMLVSALAKFKKSNKMKKWTNVDACPLNLSGAYFWSYIEYKLKEDYTNVNFNKRVLQGQEYTDRRLMNNLKLAGWIPGHGESGGIIGIEYPKFLNQVFPDQWSRFIVNKKPILVKAYTYHSSIKQIPGYTISHAIIGVMNRYMTGHAICGYICSDGTPMVYDSNNLRSFPHDWIHKNLEEYMKKKYFPEGVFPIKGITVTYIRNDFL